MLLHVGMPARTETHGMHAVSAEFYAWQEGNFKSPAKQGQNEASATGLQPKEIEQLGDMMSTSFYGGLAEASGEMPQTTKPNFLRHEGPKGNQSRIRERAGR